MRERCATCSRPLPLPKTEKSPPTKKMVCWGPADTHEPRKELLAAAAKHLGCFDQPFYESKVIDVGLVLILQDESLAGHYS